MGISKHNCVTAALNTAWQ